jgi:hypothetical protein
MSARLCVIDYMGKEPVPDVPAVTRFVREVIGCNCPDEVFQHIEGQRGSSAVKACSADCELRIGGRLLIVVTSEPVAGLAPHLAEVVAEGKRARDERKFNRFRLVVQTGKPAEESEEFFRAFESAPDRDERTHLHVLPKGEVPNFFSHAPHAD